VIGPYSICRSGHQSPDLNPEAIHFLAAYELIKPIRNLASPRTVDSEDRGEQVGLACATQVRHILKFGTDRLVASTQQPRSWGGDRNGRMPWGSVFW
jgi:hypothetical protein